jgi:uncharacterized protein (TIGR03435 family)
MPDANDMELLADYARHGSEAAFAELVQRHVALVYSAALRHVGIPAQAEEITQAVFIILARKAGSLRPGTILEGWLHETTRLTALSFLRGERRRQFREQEAYMQSTPATENPAWNEMSPLLDEALARLGKKDRDAVILRFFKEKSVRDVAATMQMNEAAAQRRILRALEKLRKFFARRGVASTTATIAGAISANSVHAAPASLAQSVTAVAVAKGAAASASTLTLIKGALKIMAWTKAKTAIVAGVGLLLAAGTTTVTVKEIQEHRRYPWEVLPFSMDKLSKAPPQVRIIPSLFPRPEGMGMDRNGKMMGLGQPLWALFPNAYHVNGTRTVFEVQLPVNHYDFIASLPQGSYVALQHEIERKFGLVTAREIINTNVLLLTLRNAGAPGLTPATQSPLHPTQISTTSNGQFWCKASPISYLATYLLEPCFQIPVVDGTGLAGTYDFTLKWNEHDWEPRDLEALKQDLLDQLGLELVPTNMPIEMLVVEKAK